MNAPFEYKVVDMNVMADSLEFELNKGSAHGWEFVSIYSHLPILSLIFKRPANPA